MKFESSNSLWPKFWIFICELWNIVSFHPLKHIVTYCGSIFDRFSTNLVCEFYHNGNDCLNKKTYWVLKIELAV